MPKNCAAYPPKIGPDISPKFIDQSSIVSISSPYCGVAITLSAYAAFIVGQTIAQKKETQNIKAMAKSLISTKPTKTSSKDPRNKETKAIFFLPNFSAKRPTNHPTKSGGSV